MCRRNGFARADSIASSWSPLGRIRLSVMCQQYLTHDRKSRHMPASKRAGTARDRPARGTALVPASGVASLEKVPFETGAGQAWIYVNQPGTIATPTVDYPIVQS